MTNNPYLSLPLDMREELCINLLNEMGITDIRHNPIRHELTHACQLSDYHTDQDRNPTCSLNYEKLAVKCLGCNASGSLLWFIAVVRGESSKSARKWVESKAGGEGEKDLGFLLKYFDALFRQRVEEEPIPVYDRRAIESWTKDLDRVLPYLESRDIGEYVATQSRLGYDSDNNALIIPHFIKSELAGWQSRSLTPGYKGPKYKNTPGFPKARSLYGDISWHKNVPTPDGLGLTPPSLNALVMEAPLSAVRHGYIDGGGKNMKSVATFGASVSREQVEILKRYDEVILWFDNDPAGWRATERVGRELLGHRVWAIDSPLSGDPGDYSREVVKDILDNNMVPFTLWNRPEALLCFKCYEMDHRGECNGI